MYCVKIYYPKSPGSTFNFEHYFKVHAPLGQELLFKHCGVKPVRILVEDLGENPVESSASPYHCICSIFFSTKDEALAMLGMFEMDEPRELLTADFPNYTQAMPEIVLTSVTEMDPDTGALHNE